MNKFFKCFKAQYSWKNEFSLWNVVAVLFLWAITIFRVNIEGDYIGFDLLFTYWLVAVISFCWVVVLWVLIKFLFVFLGVAVCLLVDRLCEDGYDSSLEKKLMERSDG